MATRKRSTSGSKKVLKEKIVQYYEAFFRVSARSLQISYNFPVSFNLLFKTFLLKLIL